MGKTFPVLLIIGLFILIFWGGGTSAQVKTIAIGTQENPWEEWGELKGLDDKSKPGWIQPRKTTRKVNILHELYEEGRLFPGEEPTSEEYSPGDGRIWTPNAGFSENKKLPMLADGKKDTVSFNYFNRRSSNNGVAIYIDLGRAYPVDEISFYPLIGDRVGADVGFHEDMYMKGYEIYANDGRPETKDKFGRPIYHLLDADPSNTSIKVENSNFPPQHIRYIKIRCTSPQSFELDQIEVRGEGYIREAVFTSRIIDLKDKAIFGRLLWNGVKEPSSNIRIRTRNGSDKTTKVYYKITDIGELEEIKAETNEEARKKWERLPPEARGPVEDDTDNWTMWSAPYDSSGEVIPSQGPRRFLQLKITLETKMPKRRALVDSLAFEISQPVMARKVLGEIVPRVNVDLGETETFTYKVYPTKVAEQDLGFNKILINTPVKPSLKEVRLRGKSLAEGEYKKIEGKDRLILELTKEKVSSNKDTLEIDFENAILAFGTVFTGKVFAGWKEGLLGQQIETRKIVDLSVQASKKSLGEVIGGVNVGPDPFTPNGDGVNDFVTIYFRVFQMIGEAPLSVDIYSSSGSFIKNLLSGTVQSGYFNPKWYGKDKEGELLSPGIYIYKISLKGDEKTYTKIGTLTLAY